VGFFVSLLFSARALANNTDWPSHGQDYKKQRYSQLAAINEENVSQLGLVWSFDTDFNHGVAVKDGKVVVGTFDARLIALDAATGKLIWQIQTADINKWPYTITGAPHIAKGKVFIGNGGAE
jgi:glucose dehydrogenase